MLKGFSELLEFKGVASVTLFSKLYFTLSLLASILVSYFIPGVLGWVYSMIILLIELSIITMLGRLKRLLDALKLILFFLLIGLAMRTIGYFFFGNPINLPAMAYYTLLLVEAFLGISIAFQILSPGELVWLACKLGLGRAGIVLALVLTHIGSIFSAYSDVITVSMLKKNKRFPSLKPLFIYTVMYGLEVNEALHLYGLPKPVIRRTGFTRKDACVIVFSSLLLIVGIVALGKII
ncbi:hypothetical protein ACSU1N_05510 [Thermogladius sp. 4427co]|uniref:hypothetical protein n=1 Tax=Thermogladius sp. 4427co TaxID=3450718 RepID=UPI003F78BD1D